MTPLLTTLTAIFETPEQAMAKLNISETKYNQYTSQNQIPSWLMRELIKKWSVNPLYIYGEHKSMTLPQV
jgi:hypothetical protein